VLGQPDAHHNNGRFRWLGIRPEGYPVMGMDYLSLTAITALHALLLF